LGRIGKKAEEPEDIGNNMLNYCKEKIQENRKTECRNGIKRKWGGKNIKNKTFKKGETMTKAKMQTEELREETEKGKRIMV